MTLTARECLEIESSRESRLREIRSSGLTRGGATPRLLYN